MALDLDLEVRVEPRRGRGISIAVDGPEARGISTDASNRIAVAVAGTLARHGKPVPGLSLRVHNSIPVGRGLGGSGAAAVAGVVAGTLLAGVQPRRADIVVHATRLEGHPDNAAPAVYGGLVATTWLGGEVPVVRLPFPALEILLLIPDRTVPTAVARRILPAQVPRRAAVFNLGRLALLLGALLRENRSLLRVAMQDELHQPHRLGLVPGLEPALSSLCSDRRCLAAVLSGSGPTLLALYDHIPPDAGRDAAAILARHGIQARLQRARPRRRGVAWRILQSA